jgi:plastocyanin
MKTLLAAIVCTILCAAGPALAGDIVVTVRDAAGAPVKAAVVTFTPAAGATIGPVDIKGPFVMAQKGIQFEPHVLIVPVGATVAFPNFDRVNHHVYSFSPAQKFQLPLYGYRQSRNMTFGTAGTVALGCNIHDQMSGYIRVVATPYYARTDDNGVATLSGLPAARGTVSVWHPMALPPGEASQTSDSGKGALSFSLRLRAK